MKAYTKEIALFLVVIACAAFLLIKLAAHKNSLRSGSLGNCGTDLQTFTMQDDWLKGTLDRGTEFTALMDWRACRGLAKEDLVLYRVSPAHDPVVREVVAIGGDHFKLVKTEDGTAWNIKINGELLMSQDKPYKFGSQQPPAIRLYEAAHKGVLDESSVLLFSKIAPGDQDSGVLGVLNVADVIGIVTQKSL